MRLQPHFDVGGAPPGASEIAHAQARNATIARISLWCTPLVVAVALCAGLALAYWMHPSIERVLRPTSAPTPMSEALVTMASFSIVMASAIAGFVAILGAWVGWFIRHREDAVFWVTAVDDVSVANEVLVLAREHELVEAVLSKNAAEPR